MANNDAKNIKLGVCRVMFDGKDLGFTKGGVEVSVETETHEVQVDQTGQTPVNEFIMGRTVTVSCPLAETTLENMVAIMPGARLVRDADIGDGSVPAARVDVPLGVGVSLLDSAKVLTLHPIALPAADRSEDFTIFRAATPGAMSFAYKIDEERIFSCEFKGYPNEDGMLFAFGDPFAGVVTETPAPPPVVNPPVDGGNTTPPVDGGNATPPVDGGDDGTGGTPPVDGGDDGDGDGTDDPSAPNP